MGQRQIPAPSTGDRRMAEHEKRSRGLDSSQCSDLIEAIARHRDKASFRQLFDHFAPRLKSYAIRTGCKDHEAEDLAQDTLISVWRNAASFNRTKANGLTWLFTIIRNKRIDMVRRTRHAHVLYEENDDDRAAEVDDPEELRSSKCSVPN